MMHFIHFLPKQAAGADGVGGGGGTSKHWLSAALRSVQSEIHMNTQEKQLCLSYRATTSCVFVMMGNCGSMAQRQHRHSGWGERRDLRVFSAGFTSDWTWNIKCATCFYCWGFSWWLSCGSFCWSEEMCEHLHIYSWTEAKFHM